MSNKEIIINADMAEEIRIAIVENQRLVDLDIEAQSRTKHKGNIYKGIISNIEDSLDAVFVEFGEEKQAFLPLSEVRPEIFPPEFRGQKKVKPSEVLSRGQEIIVQVTKDEIGTKGAAVSTYLSLPGRYVVLMHSDEGGGGISRKIENESARQAARDMLSRLSVPAGLAVIIRTAGTTASKQDLHRDFRQLCEIWQQINKGAEIGRAPTLLYREPDIVIRTIRDYFSPEVKRISIDDEEEYEDARTYFEEHMPDLVKTLELYKRKEPIFLHFGIEQAIGELYEREVKLPSGGYIIIEPTEALVSIDVNSGKSTKEAGHAATVYKTNLEATEEIARQLRLRDLGGIIVVDFIDMLSGKNRRDVERRMREAMQADKARVKVGRIGENGTLELTRQRIRQSHHLISHVPCERCKGTGRVRDAEGLAILALRNINGLLVKRKTALSALTMRLPTDVATSLNNQKRRELLALCDTFHVAINIVGDVTLKDTAFVFDEERRGQAGLDAVKHTKDHLSEVFGARNLRKNTPQDGWPIPQKNLPPPSIGPVPTLLEADEVEEAREEGETSQVHQQHFDDPILEALFGAAPQMDLSDITDDSIDDSSDDSEDADDETEASSDEAPRAEGDDPSAEGPKKRRRGRSRKRRGFRNRNQDKSTEDRGSTDGQAESFADTPTPREDTV